MRDKLAERNERHRRLGDLRYLVEPNVKEGKGGLRDLHTLFWIAKYIYRVDDVAALVDLKVLSAKEAQRFARAQGFSLDGALPPAFPLGPRRGPPDLRIPGRNRAAHGATPTHAGTRGVERFMNTYFLIAKDVGDLTRYLLRAAGVRADQGAAPHLAALARPRERSSRDLRWRRAASTSSKDSTFRDDPVNLIRMFHLAEEHGLDIHPHALRLITQSLKLIDSDLRASPEANRLFMEILTSRKVPEVVLRRMNEAGVFGRFVPDFGRVVAQMQFDMYHIYTVDEHTIYAIGLLAKIEKGEFKDELPLATSLAPTLSSRRALYLAVLLHDIAKGRGGDHSILGEEVAQKLGPRLGLTAEETETHRLAGALAFADERNRLEARHRRSADHPGTSSSACNRPSG